MEKLKEEDFKEEMESKDYDSIYKVIVEKSIELVRKIAKVKKIKLPKIDLDDESIFDEIDEIFKSNSIYFGSIETLMWNFSRWEDDYLNESKEQKIKTSIRLYNESLVRLGEYETIKQKINENKYENLKKEKVDKIIALFKEMMQYKNKKYDVNWDFNDWLDVINEKYNYFHSEIVDLYDIYYYGHVDRYMDGEEVIDVDEVEEIFYYDQIFYFLKSDYKEHAYDFIDIELKEGQSYQDVYNEEQEKLAKLFKEMLDYINVRYDSETFEGLRPRVCEEYPWYEERLRFLYSSMGMSWTTYIELIDDMEKLYSYLEKDYKNIEENKKEYEDKKREEREKNALDEDEVIFDDIDFFYDEDDELEDNE